MRKTEFQAVFKLYDNTALEDSVVTSDSNADFADLSLIKDDVEAVKYMTLEQDYFLLDGTMQEFPDNTTDMPYFSKILFGASGTPVTVTDDMYTGEGYALTVASNSLFPEVNVGFTGPHTSYGITLHFIDDAPEGLTVVWYGTDRKEISRKQYQVTGTKFFAQNQVANYAGLKIIFTNAKPYHYIKLRYIEYGTDIVFGKDGLPVKEADLTEEADIISEKIPFNKLKFKGIDEDNTFNLGNYNGLHKAFQQGQKCTAYEYIDNKQNILGLFYLDKFSVESNIATLEFTDTKGLLDNARFVDGRVYSMDLAGDVIDEIMSAAGISNYRVSEEVRQIPLYGWLKIQTCRQALREVLFACGAVADDSRRDYIDIYIVDDVPAVNIDRERKFSTSVERAEYISDVAINYKKYRLGEEGEIINEHYLPGTYTVEPSSAVAYVHGNVTIVKSNANYVTFYAPSETDVVITGRKYESDDLTVTASEEELESGQQRKTATYSTTLMSTAQAIEAANRILEYKKKRLSLKIKYLNEGESPTQWANVQNNVKRFGNYIACLTKLTTTLTGGFISTAELTGYYDVSGVTYYVGELYAGEEFGVM